MRQDYVLPHFIPYGYFMNNLKDQFFSLQSRLNLWQFSKVWHLDIYDSPAKEKIIMGQMPNYEKYLKRKEDVARRRLDVPQDALFMYEEPFLDKDQEQHLFRQYNFLKYKYKQKASVMPSRDAQLAKIVQVLENYYVQISEIKKKLVCANARLVSNLAHKAVVFDHEVAVSDGYTGLVMAVDYFDFRRKIKFITYAYLVIRDFIQRARQIDGKHRAMNNDEMMDEVPDKIDFELLVSQQEIRSKIQETLKVVTPREKQIISFYYGLDGKTPHTLDEIGKKLRISKERVRQIKMQGIERIKDKVSWANTEN